MSLREYINLDDDEINTEPYYNSLRDLYDEKKPEKMILIVSKGEERYKYKIDEDNEDYIDDDELENIKEEDLKKYEIDHFIDIKVYLYNEETKKYNYFYKFSIPFENLQERYTKKDKNINDCKEFNRKYKTETRGFYELINNFTVEIQENIINNNKKVKFLLNNFCLCPYVFKVHERIGENEIDDKKIYYITENNLKNIIEFTNIFFKMNLNKKSLKHSDFINVYNNFNSLDKNERFFYFKDDNNKRLRIQIFYYLNYDVKLLKTY